MYPRLADNERRTRERGGSALSSRLRSRDFFAERSDFLVAPLDLRLPMIYAGAVSINKRSVHDVTFEAQQWQTLANAVVA